MRTSKANSTPPLNAHNTHRHTQNVSDARCWSPKGSQTTVALLGLPGREKVTMNQCLDVHKERPADTDDSKQENRHYSIRSKTRNCSTYTAAAAARIPHAA